MTTTKHTCGGPVFGRLSRPGGCQRCDELLAGAAPVQGWGRARKYDGGYLFPAAGEGEPHSCQDSNCSTIVCTFGDW
jgi:hypothetical protein